MARKLKVKSQFIAEDLSTKIIMRIVKHIDKLNKTVDRTARQLERMARQVDQVNNAFLRMTRRVVNADKKMSLFFTRLKTKARDSLGSVALLLGGIGFVGLLHMGANAVINLDHQLIGVAKTADLSKTDILALRASVLAASQSMRGISTDQLNAYAKAAGQLGIRGVDDLTKFAVTMVKLESATDGLLQGEEAARDLVRSMNLIKEPISNVDKFASVLALLGDNANASEAEILSMVNEIARSTSQFGKFRPAEILAVSTTITETGGDPEASATAMLKFFNSVSSAVSGNSRLMRVYRKTLQATDQEIAEMFHADKAKLFTRFLQGMNKFGDTSTVFVEVDGKMEKVRRSSVELLKALDIKDVRALKTFESIASSADKMAFNLNLAGKEYEDVLKLNRDFAAAQDSLKVIVRNLSVQFRNSVNEIFESKEGYVGLKTVLIFVAKNMTTILKLTITLISVYVLWKTIVTIATAANFAYAAGLALVGMATGSMTMISNAGVISIAALRLAMLIASAASGIWAAAIWIVEAAQWALNVAMTANPIGLVILLIVAIIAALVALGIIIYKAVEDFERFGDALYLLLGPMGFILSMIDQMIEKWELLTTIFKGGSILDSLWAIGNVMLSAIISPFESLMDIIADLTGFEWAQNLKNDMTAFRNSLDADLRHEALLATGVDAVSGASEPATIDTTSPVFDAPETRLQRSINETIEKSVVDLNINAPEGFSVDTRPKSSRGDLINIQTTLGGI